MWCCFEVKWISVCLWARSQKQKRESFSSLEEELRKEWKKSQWLRDCCGRTEKREGCRCWLKSSRLSLEWVTDKTQLIPHIPSVLFIFSTFSCVFPTLLPLLLHFLSSLTVATLSRFHKTFKDTFKCFLSYESDFKREWIIGFLNNSLYLKAYIHNVIFRLHQANIYLRAKHFGWWISQKHVQIIFHPIN